VKEALPGRLIPDAPASSAQQGERLYAPEEISAMILRKGKCSSRKPRNVGNRAGDIDTQIDNEGEGG
jgi:hypothetical protein